MIRVSWVRQGRQDRSGSRRGHRALTCRGEIRVIGDFLDRLVILAPRGLLALLEA